MKKSLYKLIFILVIDIISGWSNFNQYLKA